MYFGETECIGVYLGLVAPASTVAAQHRVLHQGAPKMLVGHTGPVPHPYPYSVRTVAELHSTTWMVHFGSHCDPLQEPLNLNTVASDCHCLKFNHKSMIISANIYRNKYLDRQAHLINLSSM